MLANRDWVLICFGLCTLKYCYYCLTAVVKSQATHLPRLWCSQIALAGFAVSMRYSQKAPKQVTAQKFSLTGFSAILTYEPGDRAYSSRWLVNGCCLDCIAFTHHWIIGWWTLNGICQKNHLWLCFKRYFQHKDINKAKILVISEVVKMFQQFNLTYGLFIVFSSYFFRTFGFLESYIQSHPTSEM